MEPSNPHADHIFLLGGQSNMSGRGGVLTTNHEKHWDGVVPSQCSPHSAILSLSPTAHWEVAREPLHRGIDGKRVCGVGPGLAFANSLRESLDGVIGLVPCAEAATSIKSWQRGTPLYDRMVERAREGVKFGGEIKGVLWYLGGSDTSALADAEGFGSNMEKLIEDLREDLELPSLPIIQVAIASGKEYVEIVREAQLGMEIKDAICVDSRGVELQEDGIHFTTMGEVHLGLMLAQAFKSHFLVA